MPATAATLGFYCQSCVCRAWRLALSGEVTANPGFPKLLLKASWPERYDGTAEISIGKGSLDSALHAGPVNHGLHAANFRGEEHSVIDALDGDGIVVSDEWTAFGEILLSVRGRHKGAVSGSRHADVGVSLRIEPDDGAFPVVTVADGGERLCLVLWHVPCVHDCPSTATDCCPDIDLSFTGAAVAARSATWI